MFWGKETHLDANIILQSNTLYTKLFTV